MDLDAESEREARRKKRTPEREDRPRTGEPPLSPREDRQPISPREMDERGTAQSGLADEGEPGLREKQLLTVKETFHQFCDLTGLDISYPTWDRHFRDFFEFTRLYPDSKYKVITRRHFNLVVQGILNDYMNELS